MPFLVTRAVLVLAANLSLLAVPLSRYVLPEWKVPVVSTLVDAFGRWDATHYAQIAAEGYTRANPSNAAFFPFFPALVRVVAELAGPLTPAGFAIAALVVANVALVAAVSGIVALARLDFGRRTARRAGWAMLAFPSAFFLSAGYAESTFLALSIWAYLAGRSGQWTIAGILCAGAALTRPFGLLLVVPLVVEWVIQWRTPTTDRRYHAVLGLVALGIVVAAFGGFLMLLADRLGDPLAFIHAQGAWSRGLTPPWMTLALFFDGKLTFNSGQHALVDLAFGLLLFVLVTWSWRVLRPALALYGTALVVVLFSTGSFLSMPRFVLAAFPVFLVLALASRNPTFERAYLVSGMGIGAVWMGLFAAYYWVS